MTVKNLLFAASAGMLLLLSSCQKDLTVAPEESISASVSSDATGDVIETVPPVWTSVVANVNSNDAGIWQGVPAKYNQTKKK